MGGFFAKLIKKLIEKDKNRIGYCAITDKGGRENNEDAYIIITTGRKNILYLFVVADGLGGQAAGETASSIAVTELSEIVKKGVTDTISLELMKDLLAKGFKKANDRICRQAVNEKYGMGTTLVVALLNDEGKGFVANVGDSRAYLIGNNIKRITKDHSYVQELIDRGVIIQEEAAGHPQKNIVTKILGMKGVGPDFFEIELGENTLLLCSDGLTTALRDEEIRDIIIYSKIKDTCENLVKGAKPKSRDNITVIAVKKR